MQEVWPSRGSRRHGSIRGDVQVPGQVEDGSSEGTPFKACDRAVSTMDSNDFMYVLMQIRFT